MDATNEIPGAKTRIRTVYGTIPVRYPFTVHAGTAS